MHVGCLSGGKSPSITGGTKSRGTILYGSGVGSGTSGVGAVGFSAIATATSTTTPTDWARGGCHKRGTLTRRRTVVLIVFLPIQSQAVAWRANLLLGLMLRHIVYPCLST